MPSRESARRILFDRTVVVVLAALSPVWLLLVEPFPAGSDATAALRLLAVPGYLVLAAVNRVVAVGLGVGNESVLFWAVVALAFYAVAVVVAAAIRRGRLAMSDLLA